MDNQKGSAWSKWDLHIHTPFTKLNDNYRIEDDEDIWKEFCSKIEASDVDVFGITDYFTADNYFELVKKHREHYPNSQKVFFPNVEFRLDVSVNKNAEEVNIHVIFSNTVDKSKIDSFLQKLNTNITRNLAKVSCKELTLKSEYICACVDCVNLKEKLIEVFGKDNCYIIIAAANNAGLRPDTKSPRKLNITDEIDKVCDAFFGGQQNVEYYLDVDRYETDEKAKSKPVIGGSDAHSFEDVENFLGRRFIKNNPANGKAQIVKDITWIKAELSFNGLKQIIYEPLHRVQIAEIAPREPIRNLDKIKFKFPSKIQIKKRNSLSQDLCIGCITKEISFSRYFTCLIGGRGTGKSTIINLISERLGQKTDFFGENQNGLFLQGSNSRYDIKSDPSNFIEIGGTNDIEFVSQGKIEKLTEGQELTDLIFKERILEPDTELKTQRDKVDSLISIIEEQIDLIRQIDELKKNISEKQKEADNYQNVIDSINDPIYVSVTKEISNLSTEKAIIEGSRNKYQILLNRIQGIVQETKIVDEIKNLYEDRVGEIIEYLTKIDEFKVENGEITVSLKTFDEIVKRLEEVEEQLNNQQASLAQFFIEKGTSEESVKDSLHANESLARSKEQIKELSALMSTAQERILENADKIKELKILSVKTESKIRDSIQSLNIKLETKNENVLRIRYEFESLAF